MSINMIVHALKEKVCQKSESSALLFSQPALYF